MADRPSALGIDIGSVSVKVVLVRGRQVLRTAYRRFRGGPFETLLKLLTDDFGDLVGQRFHLGHTGIGGKTSQSLLSGRFFGEIAGLAAGNYLLVPDVRTVVEMGGEDSKYLALDSEKRVIVDFSMNAQCAAGTGSFLDQQAGRLRLTIEQFGQLALKSQRPPRLAGRCSVFAKSDMIHLQQIATPDHDIVAGLCFAVARNFKGSIARGKRFDEPIAFEGGVAANPGMIRAFTEVFGLQPGKLIIPEHFNVIGAIGAALLASQNQVVGEPLDPDRIRAYLASPKAALSQREALSFDYPDSKFYDVTLADRPVVTHGLAVYLGIDVGSLSTNLVLLDDDLRVVAKRYLMTEGRPIEAVRRGLKEIGEEVGERVTVKAVGTTGSGRHLTGDFVGADTVRNEITAQATAAISIDPTVDTIFEIGGQDSKFISLDDRSVVDFEMNRACAAGTGSFLQEQAEKLDVSIEGEFGAMALSAPSPVGCGERCTVFMESDLVAHQRRGVAKENLMAGLAYSIATNYLTRVVGDRRVGANIFFQGGVAFNQAVVAAFEKLLKRSVTVPPHHDVTGAIGTAILAREESQNPGFAGTAFKGFDLHKRHYRLESFTCNDCSNQCEIHKVAVENAEPLFYGSRCEKYDIKKTAEPKLPDYVKLCQKLLFHPYATSNRGEEPRGRIGIPRVLHFYDNYPFWYAFFESLGFRVVNSDVSNHRIEESALELFSAETCYPIKIVYGHVANLLEKEIDYLFLPSIIKVSGGDGDSDEAAYICPYVQTIGAAIKARFDFQTRGVSLVNPPLSLIFHENELLHSLRRLSSCFRLSDKELRAAVRVGLRAYREYKRRLYREGDRILSELRPDEKAMVIISRPYNGNDPRLSLDLPRKINRLGYRAIPLDFLRLNEDDIEFPYMYWRYGRRILKAAEMIREHPQLFAVYITSFGCGPDSFISHFFRQRMTGKPYLQLELDEHSADAGLITRCEAFADSLRFYRHQRPVSRLSVNADRFRGSERVVYIPYMCDHAFALRAAFERCGLHAEVLDEPDEETLEWGKRFTSGKECFPCIVTTGDMVKKIRSQGFDPARTIFFMPGADGPCRFGLYSQYHRVVLDELGYPEVPIYSPNSNDGYSQFGLDGTVFRRIAWGGIVFVDHLVKMLHRVRPYEITAGETEKLYLHYLNRASEAIVRDNPLTPLGREAAQVFAAVEVDRTRRPVVGVVGEIYLRNNRFSNNHLIDKLESLGLEARLASFGEWPMYVSTTYRLDSIADRDLGGIIHSTLQLLTQRRLEHKIFKSFARHFDVPSDAPVHRVLRLASDYLSVDFKGEAILSIGKAIEMIHAGASGIVNAMPFNCMPGTIVSSLSKTVSGDFGGVPWLNISYEGLRDSGEDTRLEAFAEQVQGYAVRVPEMYNVSG